MILKVVQGDHRARHRQNWRKSCASPQGKSQLNNWAIQSLLISTRRRALVVCFESTIALQNAWWSDFKVFVLQLRRADTIPEDKSTKSTQAGIQMYPWSHSTLTSRKTRAVLVCSGSTCALQNLWNPNMNNFCITAVKIGCDPRSICKANMQKSLFRRRRSS